MRYSILLLSAALFCSLTISGQKIKYESSLEKARTLSLQQKKPLAVLITIVPPVYTPNYFRGLDDDRVIERFNANFINFKVDREDTTVALKLIQKYNIYRFPAMLFFDRKGGLMFFDVAIVSFPQQLLGLADKAISASGDNSLADYDSIYNAGNRIPSFIKDYISKRERSGISDNAELIEQYVDGLKVSDLNKYDEVLFILKAGPYADGNAYKLSRTNKLIIDSIYKTEPLAVRSAMNNAIITNTMKGAIAGKNSSRANAAASFTASTWGKNYKEGQKNYQLKMIQYYEAVKDTIKYLKLASAFYDQYYMSISPDSVRKIDSLNFAAARNKSMINATEIAKVRVNDTVLMRTIKGQFTFSYERDRISTGLNNAAWSFYLMAGRKEEYLVKAMLWSRRATELSPKAPFYDTYSHLLYKLKFYDEAESMSKKAIEAAKKDKMDIIRYQEEYTKIKGRTL